MFEAIPESSQRHILGDSRHILGRQAEASPFQPFCDGFEHTDASAPPLACADREVLSQQLLHPSACFVEVRIPCVHAFAPFPSRPGPQARYRPPQRSLSGADRPRTRAVALPLQRSPAARQRTSPSSRAPSASRQGGTPASLVTQSWFRWRFAALPLRQRADFRQHQELAPMPKSVPAQRSLASPGAAGPGHPGSERAFTGIAPTPLCLRIRAVLR